VTSQARPTAARKSKRNKHDGHLQESMGKKRLQMFIPETSLLQDDGLSRHKSQRQNADFCPSNSATFVIQLAMTSIASLGQTW
jgi:hypothetical protein